MTLRPMPLPAESRVILADDIVTEICTIKARPVSVRTRLARFLVNVQLREDEITAAVVSSVASSVGTLSFLLFLFPIH